MATYTVTVGNRIEINFNGITPDEATRDKMKSVKFRWDPGSGSRTVAWAV